MLWRASREPCSAGYDPFVRRGLYVRAGTRLVPLGEAAAEETGAEPADRTYCCAERFLHQRTPPGRLETMMMACMIRDMARDLSSGTPTRLKKKT
jgi:hypothetical protein